MTIWPRRAIFFGAALLAATALPLAAEKSMDGDVELLGVVMGLGAPCVQFRVTRAKPSVCTAHRRRNFRRA